MEIGDMAQGMTGHLDHLQVLLEDANTLAVSEPLIERGYLLRGGAVNLGAILRLELLDADDIVMKVVSNKDVCHLPARARIQPSLNSGGSDGVHDCTVLLAGVLPQP